MVGTAITLHASGDFVSIAEQRVSDFATKNGFKEGKRKAQCKELLYTKTGAIGGMTFFSVSFRKHPDAVAIQVNAASTPPLYMLVDPCPGLYSFINIIDDNGKEKHVNLETYVLSLILSEYREYADNKQPEDYMQLSLSYGELASIVSRHLGEDIKFEYGGNPSRIKARIQHFSFYLTIRSVKDNTIVVSHQIGRDAEIAPRNILIGPCHKGSILGDLIRTGYQNIVRKLLNRVLGKKMESSSVEAFKLNEDGTVSIALTRVNSLRHIFRVAELHDITFDENQVTITIQSDTRNHLYPIQ